MRWATREGKLVQEIDDSETQKNVRIPVTELPRNLGDKRF